MKLEKNIELSKNRKLPRGTFGALNEFSVPWITKIKAPIKPSVIPINNPDDFRVILNSFDNMIYDKNKIEVNSGKNIILTLNHKGKVSKEFMGHNFVLLKKGVNVDEYAKKAVLAKSNDYIPNSDEAIAYTKMLGGGESTTISFLAPEPGTYNYICTFPGHYMMMRGELIVN